MILNKAVNRIKWRFSQGKAFTPNENDIKSFNSIVGFINDFQNDSFKNNQLFAKLYIFFLDEHIKYYKSDIFDLIPQQALSRLLDTPLRLSYKSFHKNMISNYQDKILAKNGLEDIKTPSERTEQENADIQLRIDNMSDEDKLNIFKETYSLEFVTERLDEMIINALTRFSNV